MFRCFLGLQLAERRGKWAVGIRFVGFRGLGFRGGGDVGGRGAGSGWRG